MHTAGAHSEDTHTRMTVGDRESGTREWSEEGNGQYGARNKKSTKNARPHNASVCYLTDPRKNKNITTLMAPHENLSEIQFSFLAPQCRQPLGRDDVVIAVVRNCICF